MRRTALAVLCFILAFASRALADDPDLKILAPLVTTELAAG